MKHDITDTIIALSTPPGQGAIGVIRLSGCDALEKVDEFFFGKNLTKVDANTVHYGKLRDEQGRIIDECVATIFKAPRSYTRENVVELSCHGSPYILDQAMQLFLRNGVRMANKGEFTLRAFLNGQLDLSQAEAVADLIASESASSHELAMKQLRGGFSDKISELRQELIDFAALIELELDFGEEDVTFADRGKLERLVQEIQKVIKQLIDSFAYGNAIKKGIPVAIVGRPNVGKSTLLNALLNDNRAIVSSIAGTTRDVIEDNVIIDGIQFRFVDTAGIRETTDEIEQIGITKSKEQITKAKIVLYLDDVFRSYEDIAEEYNTLDITEAQTGIIILNKSDLVTTCQAIDVEEAISTMTRRTKTITISAQQQDGIDQLTSHLVAIVQSMSHQDDVTVTNARHFEALTKANQSLDDVLNGLHSGITADFVAMDIRQALHHLGMITGEIHTDDLLDSIFSRFCIGK